MEAKKADVAANLKNALAMALKLDIFKSGTFSVPQILGQIIANEDEVRAVFRNGKLNKNVVFKAYNANEAKDVSVQQEKTAIPAYFPLTFNR